MTAKETVDKVYRFPDGVISAFRVGAMAQRWDEPRITAGPIRTGVLKMSMIVLAMSTTLTDTAGLLFGQIRSRLLAALCEEPEKPFYLRQLARQIASSPGVVQRELKLLTQVGLVLRTENDKQISYRPNQEHPIYSDLCSLMSKTAGLFSVLRRSLEPISEKVEFAFVYGSFARNEVKADSDVDLLVAGRVTLDDVLEILFPLERRIKRPINPTVYSSRELRSKLHAGNHFLTALQKVPAVFLLGQEDEFRALR